MLLIKEVISQENKLEIPLGTKCELCGMLATAAVKDSQGVTHYYCEHHVPGHQMTEGRQAEHSQHQMGKPADKGSDRHGGHSVNMFRDKFFLSLLLTIPVVLYSDLIQRVLGFTAPPFPSSQWVAPVFSTVVFFYGGMVFLKSA
ncbi:MAG: hypothetical protein WEC39_00580, partial [Patescibacteria group bacterium]